MEKFVTGDDFLLECPGLSSAHDALNFTYLSNPRCRELKKFTQTSHGHGFLESHNSLVSKY